MKRVLFTGGGGAGNESIYKTWMNQYSLFFCDADKNAINPIIPPELCFQIPFANAPHYTADLIALCKKLAIEVLVPGVDEELVFMQEIKNMLPELQILCPEDTFIHLMQHKFSFVQALNNNNLNAPKTILLSDHNKIPTFSYPAIIKPVTGRGSRGVLNIDRPDQIEAYRSLYYYNDRDLVLQEKIEGDEYTVFMSADKNGMLGSIIPVKVNIKKGITIDAEIDYNSHVLDYCKTFHSAFKPKACYNIQLMLTANNDVFPFEVNPRISTTFCLAIATGYDPIKTYLQNDLAEFYLPKTKHRLKRAWSNFITEVA